MLNIYRVVKFPVTLNISDIEGPYSGFYPLQEEQRNEKDEIVTELLRKVCTVYSGKFLSKEFYLGKEVK